MTVELGVLVSEKRYERLLASPTDPLRLQAVDQEARFDVRTLFVPVRQLDLDTGQARFATATAAGWQEQTRESPPRLFYNLLVRPPRPEGQALRTLNGDQRVLIFNETNRWHRGMAFEMLTALPGLRDLVPPALPFDADSLDALAAGPGPVLLAADRRPLRQSAVLLQADGPRVRYLDAGRGAAGTLHRREWASVCRCLFPLLCWASPLPGWPVGPARSPAEWRFYLTRADSGAWAVAAGLAKRDVLRIGDHPEAAWALEPALAEVFGSEGPVVAGHLQAAALAVARTLSRFMPGIAHCALDFWVDSEGRPMLVDLTGRFRIDWLRRVGDAQGLRQVVDHPVRFARLLARTGVAKLDVDFGRAG